mmetsp:Transcript_69122/g.102750  ORF Transcript_69122/g.102750 Transcript_69122/m.102750 type:complete len:223 (+) Transcript_69122:4021-4689(+)
MASSHVLHLVLVVLPFVCHFRICFLNMIVFDCEIGGGTQYYASRLVQHSYHTADSSFLRKFVVVLVDAWCAFVRFFVKLVSFHLFGSHHGGLCLRHDYLKVEKNVAVGGKVYSIPILISADLHGLIDEIIFFEDTPVAYSKHSGTTIAVDNCKYFKSQLGLNDKNFCLFIKHQSSPKGWIRMLPLNSIESVSVDLNADLNMTAPAPDFIRASLCESANQCKM